MRKFLAILCAVTLFMTGVSAVSAENDDIKVTLNGNPITFDVPPQIINNRTMVPLRAVFEAMGAMVTWDGDIDIKLNEKIIRISVGENTMSVNYTHDVWLDSPACIIDGRTLVPVRAISESLGANVNWNEVTKTVEIAYQPIYPLPLTGEQILPLFQQWHSICCFEKETLSNKEFAFDFIKMWIDYDEKDPVYIRGGKWNDGYESEWIVLGSREKLNAEYKLLFGCDMPYFTEEDLPEDGSIIMYNGQFAVFSGRYEFGEGCWPIYNHAEKKPDGSYDLIFNEWLDYDEFYCLDTSVKYVFNISLADNENGFIINSHRYYENGVLQPLYYTSNLHR